MIQPIRSPSISAPGLGPATGPGPGNARAPLFKIFDGAPGLPGFGAFLAPVLDKPWDLDSTFLSTNLNRLQTYITMQQFGTSQQTIKMVDGQRDTIAANQEKNKQAIRDNEKEATETAGEQNVAGWLGSIGGLLGAVLGLAAMGGPAGLLIGGIGVVMAVMDLISKGLAERGVKIEGPLGGKQALDISIPGLVGLMTDAIIAQDHVMASSQDAHGNYLDANGNVIDPNKIGGKKIITADEANELRTGVSVGVSVAIAVGMIAAGHFNMKSLEKAASAGGKAASLGQEALNAAQRSASNWRRIAQAGSLAAEYVQVAAAFFSGAKGIQLAEINSETDRARADGTYWDVMFNNYGIERGLVFDHIRRLMSNYDQNTTWLSDAIRNAGDTSRTITHHI